MPPCSPSRFDGAHIVPVKEIITGGGAVVRVEVFDGDPLTIFRRKFDACAAAADRMYNIAGQELAEIELLCFVGGTTRHLSIVSTGRRSGPHRSW